MNILGIESSCDETGIALYNSKRGLLADVLHSQIDIHQCYGGVVPELASRDHMRYILPLMQKGCAQAGISASDIDGIAYTRGPGLMGALLVGGCVAQALSFGWRVPVLGVHHMEGHLLAPMLERNVPTFPFLVLLVSGGHSQLVEARQLGNYRILGDTLDDAAGEAFDKVSTLLGLGYPGGPSIAHAALRGRAGHFRFPRPMTNRSGLDFSFSGLKTFVANTIASYRQSGTLEAQVIADIAYCV